MGLMKQTFISAAALYAAFAVADVSVGEVSAEELAPAPVDWMDKAYPYLIVDQALSDTLNEFGRNLGLPIEVSGNAGKKRVHRHDHEGNSGEFLKFLAAKHGLDWVFDGGRLFVSSIDERITRSWSGDASTLERVKAALAQTGIDHPRYAIAMGSDRDVFSLTAPPRYMAEAAPVVEGALTPEATRTVNVIHGRARASGT